MLAHADDLRAEVNDDEWVARVARDYRTAELSQVDRALCDHAVKLTRQPQAMAASDIDLLRSAGLDDRTIGDATQVIAYFNYINRVADGLGVDPEP